MKRRYGWKLCQENDLAWQRVEDFQALVLPHPVVLVNGCFDILHSGHLRIFHAARRLATPSGTVVCAMDGDERVEEMKGRGRPILCWTERAAALEFMPIDYLVEFNTDGEFIQLVQAISPDVRVQSSEYRGRTSKVPEIKKYFIPCTGISTTEIVRRIKERI